SNGHGATAAPDIDDVVVRLGARAVDQDIGDGLEQNVLGLLAVGPTLTARTVPVRNLVRVLNVTCWWFHDWFMSVVTSPSRQARAHLNVVGGYGFEPQTL